MSTLCPACWISPPRRPAARFDLRKGYHQIHVNPQDMQKNAVTIPFSSCSSKEDAHRTILPMVLGQVIRDCQEAFAWVDNIVACSRNHEGHLGHVRQVLQTLQEKGLVNNGEKCVWELSLSWTTLSTRRSRVLRRSYCIYC